MAVLQNDANSSDGWFDFQSISRHHGREDMHYEDYLFALP